MDTLSHALIGAAVCSKTGLGGGRTGPRKPDGSPALFDWTLPVAFLFGLLPDILSLGWYLIWYYVRFGNAGWRSLPPYIFTLYNWTHSLVIIACVLLLIRGLCPKLLLPALAWPLHVITDMFSHGEGRFSTPILWPISDVRFHGINWWQHPWLSRLAWIMVMVVWTGIVVYRRRNIRRFRRAQPMPVTGEGKSLLDSD